MACYTCLNEKQDLSLPAGNARLESRGWLKVGIGVISLLFSVGLLYKTEELYDDVRSSIVELGDNSNLVDPANEGRPVYLKGRLQVAEPLTEPEYGVTIAAVKLKRRVQMYQWVEVNEELESWWDVPSAVVERPAVTYTTAWRDKLVDSSLFTKPFGHANPKTFPVDSGVSVSETVHVGAFTLGRELKELFASWTLLTGDQRPDRRDIKMHSGLYYHSFDVWNPDVGDTRVQVSYAGAANDKVTILARQVGVTLQPYYANDKDLTTVIEEEKSLSEILFNKFPSSGIWLIRIPAYFAIYCAYSSLTFTFYWAAGPRVRTMHMFLQSNKSLLCHIFSAITLFAVMGYCWMAYSALLGALHLTVSLLLVLYCIFKAYSLYYYLNR